MKIAEGDKLVTETIDIVTTSVVKYMLDTGLTMCTAESCTGGMISELITSVPGASGMFLGGACTYTEQIKQKLLAVKADTLRRYTVYSEQVASEMSLGAMKLFGADIAIGVTGVAGPGGYNEEKPAGSVYVSVRNRSNEIVRNLKLNEKYEGLDRTLIRRLTAKSALEMVMELCKMKAEDEG